MLKEILGGQEELEAREKIARRISALIFPLWIFLLFFNAMLYTMADRIMELEYMYKTRTALEEIIVFLQYQMISVVLGGILGILIFVSIILAERPSTLNKLGGILFGASAIFDGLMAYEMNNVRAIYIEILQKFIVLTREEFNNYMNLVEIHYNNIILYNRLSAIVIGVAFVFFGVDSIIYSKKIIDSIASIPNLGLVITYANVDYNRAINKIRGGANRMKFAGYLFVISGVLDIAFGIFMSGEAANIAFIMFLIGLFIESSATKSIRDGYMDLIKAGVISVPGEEGNSSEGANIKLPEKDFDYDESDTNTKGIM